MDVLVNKQLKLQMSSPIDSGRCLRFRSSTVCWTSCLCHRDGYALCKLCSRLEIPQRSSLLVVATPVVVQRQVLVEVRVNMLDEFQHFSARGGAQTKSEEGSLPFFLMAFFALRPFGRRVHLVRTFWGALDG